MYRTMATPNDGDHVRSDVGFYVALNAKTNTVGLFDYRQWDRRFV